MIGDLVKVYFDKKPYAFGMVVKEDDARIGLTCTNGYEKEFSKNTRIFTFEVLDIKGKVQE